jgi:hypothetical protein
MEAERHLAKAIYALIHREVFPEGFNRFWFEEILLREKAEDGKVVVRPVLRTTYTSKYLNKAMIAELVKEPPNDVPPFDLGDLG